MSDSPSPTAATSAVVLGAGSAGMLAATVLARHVDRVTVFDRDRLPQGPEQRRGVPQARHSHVLWSGGGQVVESLLPGTVEALLAAGAHRISLPEQMVSLTAYGWQHRFPATQSMIAASRSLLDWLIREAALRESRITVREETDLVGLCGDAGRITGVTVRPRQRGGAPAVVEADLVVDATGRGSPLKRWLTELGLPPVREDVIDAGMAYATRVYRAPAGVGAFPLVSLYADHRAGVPGRNGMLLPIEEGRWMVTLSGTRGSEPPVTPEGFDAFLRTLRHPLIADLVAGLEPLTPVHSSRSTANRRLFYDRLARWPEGLVVLGDALAAFNPVYGHGISSAALSARELDRALDGHGLAPGLAQAVQRTLGAVVDTPWSLATSQDIRYPDCRSDTQDPRLGRYAEEHQRAADLVGTFTVNDPLVSAAALEVSTLAGPPDRLQAPDVRAVLAGGAHLPPLTAPPLTAQEHRAAGLPPLLTRPSVSSSSLGQDIHE
ncbi:FAD-dependent oxidoreductase [Streptomyces sp. NBC_01485]|uniref:NAD(P)/FAD-dependent oxidoreductase n=1 Tax=Streptomyces sp. NBC_01485 TaxID=2903884 RepID=UPI002E36492E|nr:FAD-dependent oxidoreductase [Streptomyces sp. NBC_01485]